jgi:5-methylcytosine-specific restriction endonuclease McrA
VRQYQLRCVPGAQTYAVYERDNWVCQLCGRDIRAAQQAYQAQREAKARELYGDVPSQRWYGHHNRYCPRWRAWLEEFGYGRGRFSEVDHIVPVSEGGGLCTLDNLRLICGQCHAQETKELAGRLARKRKGES